MKSLSIKLFLIMAIFFSLSSVVEAARWKFIGTQFGDKLSLSVPVKLSRNTRYARSNFLYQLKKPLKIRGLFYKINTVTMNTTADCNYGHLKVNSLIGHSINKRITRKFRLTYVIRNYNKGTIRVGSKLKYAKLFATEKRAARFMCQW